MISKIFIDSDVIIDVTTARMPFFENSKAVLAHVENHTIVACTSSNCIANVHYILRKHFGDSKAREIIKGLIYYVEVIAVEHQDIRLALDSDFKDFEDSLQFYSALRNGCQAIITRNAKDYQQATIDVYSPSEFLQL